MPGRPQIAIVDEELPWPANSGKRIRTFELLRRLTRDYRIHYIAHQNADPAEREPALAAMRDFGFNPIVVDHVVPPKRGIGFAVRLLKNIASPLPFSVQTHDSFSLRACLAQVQARLAIDLWQAEWTPYARAFDALAPDGVPRLVMAHNVESRIWQRATETAMNPLSRRFLKLQWQRFERFEGGVYRRAFRVVAVSRDDARRIETTWNTPQVDVVENGVDTTRFTPPDDDSPRQPKRLLFLGSLDWRANQQCVSHLLDSILPEIWRRDPEVMCQIVGRNPPRWLRSRIATLPRVELHANVEAVVPYLQRAACLAVPLQIGGGSRLKILEALATGTPVVSTRVGAEGLELDERHLTLAEPDGFAERLLATIRNPEEARAGPRGRDVVLANYDWETLCGKLAATWDELLAARRATRSSNPWQKSPPPLVVSK